MDRLDQFTDELHAWSLTGKEPESAAGELRYYLNCQEQRLKHAGIEREEEFSHVKDEIKGSIPRHGNGYTSKIVYREARQKVTYRKNGKVIRKIDRPVNIYATMLDREHRESGTFTCPNCGHSLTAVQASEGCPYCGTFFEMDEKYPCFTNMYTVNAIVERGTLEDNMKKEMKIVFAIAGTLWTVLTFFTWNEMTMIPRIIASLLFGVFVGGVFTFIWYMGHSLFLVSKLFYEAGRALPLMKGLNTRKKMTEFMRSYDPGFSFESFEGRVVSLLRATAFTEDRKSLTICEDDRYIFPETLADMQYRGVMYIRKQFLKGNVIHVDADVYMTDTYAGRIVREKDEKFRLSLEKEADAIDDPGFSALKVSCDGCGGSFDAMHQKCCPYCGREYELKKKDWIITSLRKV